MANYRHRGSNWKRNRKRRYKDGFPSNDVPQCPYCGQNVRDVLTAISINEGENPSHFDCVIKKLSEEEKLNPKEKICYLGGGSFGIVRFKNSSDPTQFTVKKRIRVEAENQDISWRKAVSQRLYTR